VSPSDALNFKMKADAIPFMIEGTTADPKFVPDVKGMAGSLLKGVVGDKNANNPLSGVSGMFKKKPK
jgi:hypothetical protein